MPADDDLEGYMSSLSLKPMFTTPSSNVNVPLLEDVEWVDSLLIEEPEEEASENSRNLSYSFSDALSEALRDEHASMAAMKDNNSPVYEFQLSNVNGEIEVDSDNEALMYNENTDVLWSGRKLKNAFRTTYTEGGVRGSGAVLIEDDELLVSGFVMDQPVDDIFKVWDLGFENEWIEQLNKVLDESSFEPSPLPSPSPLAYASSYSKDLIDIDDIISGMEDLSLNRFL